MARCIFNPEHDLSLADGTAEYIPPASAVEFANWGKWLEKYMLPPSLSPSGESEEKDVGQVQEIVPWGWNRSLKRRLLEEGYPVGTMPDDAFLELVRHNSRREIAVDLLGRLSNNCSGEIISPGYRCVAGSIDEILKFIAKRGKVVLKAPLSGSGKGVRFVSDELSESDAGWCRKVLERQGTVVVEERVDVVQEFAMLFEYEVEKERCGVKFLGYSLFYACNGAYKGNVLASNKRIVQVLEQWIPRRLLENVQVEVEEFLQEKLGATEERGEPGHWRGFVGVDQFVCIRGGVLYYNPAVEVNFRMTMGHIARNIYDFYREEYGLGDGTHCFEPMRCKNGKQNIFETLCRIE